MKLVWSLILIVAGLLVFSGSAFAKPTLKQIWVSPNGSDSNKGTKASPLKSLNQAWNRVPNKNANALIYLKPGSYIYSSPNYWENKSGKIIVAGSKTTVLPAVNIYNVHGLQFKGITFKGDIHCEKCNRFSLIKVNAHLQGAWETIKINQSRNIQIKNSSFSGAGDNVLDFVAVQNAKILNNSFSQAGDWCGYVKGGSANITVKNNLFTNCGTGGFTAGQGTGFQFMVPPFIKYEAYNVLVEKNTVRDTQGAAFGVNGGKNVTFKYNKALDVGQRSHLLEVVFGMRSCDGAPGTDPVRKLCNRYLNQGGWGTVKQDFQTGGIILIPNKNIKFIGNVISSPNNFFDGNQQILSLRGNLEYQPGSNVPRNSSGDQNLFFKRNILWARPLSLNLGLGDACKADNQTCNKTILLSLNKINKHQPLMVGSRKLKVVGWAANYIKPKNKLTFAGTNKTSKS
jgi:hypothetical protein